MQTVTQTDNDYTTRRDITGIDKTIDVLAEMSEGNPGAVSVFVALFKERPDDAVFVVLFLDDMNIRGEQVWIGYKYHCEQDIHRFAEAVLAHDPAMVETINRMSSRGWLAVTGGASIEGRRRKTGGETP